VGDNSTNLKAKYNNRFDTRCIHNLYTRYKLFFNVEELIKLSIEILLKYK